MHPTPALPGGEGGNAPDPDPLWGGGRDQLISVEVEWRGWVAVREIVEAALGNDGELMEQAEWRVGLARFDAADAGLIDTRSFANVFLAVALGEALDAHGLPNSHRDRWIAGDGPKAKLGR